MRVFLLLFVVYSISIHAQSYSVSKVASYANGNSGPMNGVPGDLFTTIVTFSDSSAATVSLSVKRFLNNKPAYWAICYCYIQCHSPSEDSILVTVQPFSTEIVALQFKTDSVNPGIAHSSFEIYELGYQSKADTMYMMASTQQMSTVGLKSQTTNASMILYPNPVINDLNILLNESINLVKIYDALGQVKNEFKIVQDTTFSLDISGYPKGIYFVEVNSDRNKYMRNFIKN